MSFTNAPNGKKSSFINRAFIARRLFSQLSRPITALLVVFSLFIAFLALSATFPTASAAGTVLASWGFEGVTTTNTGQNAIVSVGSGAADSGVLTAGSAFTAFHTNASTVWSNPAGNGSTKAVSSNNWSVGDYYQFAFSTSGYNAINITWDQTGSATGPRDFKVRYSTDGSTFTDATGTNSTYSLGGESWSSGSTSSTSRRSLDLSSVSALNNLSTVYIRLVDNSTTSINGGTAAAGGTGRIDNFNASGTAVGPTPSQTPTPTPTPIPTPTPTTTPTPNNAPPTITAPANPITTVAQDSAPFNVGLTGSDDNNVFNWSAITGTGISSVTVASGQGTNSITYTVTLQSGFSGTASFTARLSDNVNPQVSQIVNITVTAAPPPPSDHVVISQVYGGGGNAGPPSAAYLNDYVELYNPSPTTFNLNGWSVQYASATGGFSIGTLTPLGGPIAPGEYYLVKLASGGSTGIALPQSNVEGITNMSATNGKVALVNNSDPLTDGSSPCTLSDPNLVDFVGFGTANCREGSANAPAGSNALAVTRNGGGAVDTNQNSADFTALLPNPRRTAIILDAPPSVSSTDTDSDPFAGTPAPLDASIAVFFSEPVEVTGTWYDITCVSTGPHTAVVAAGPRNWVITPDVNFQPGEQCTFQIFAANVKDSDTDDSQPNTDFMQASYSTNFTVATGAPEPYDPSVHLTMGNPNNAIANISQPNNYLMEKPEYSVSYNRDRGGPNWVSWHLSDDWTGSLTRVDTFRPDPGLPAAWNRVNQFDYTGSGFDRGHMTPSADRLKTLPINQATFLMDNIIPQAPDNNQITWNNMEQALRTFTPANELYIIAGGAGTGGSGDNGAATTIAGGRITVPAFTWKVALVIPKGEDDISRVSCASRTIAVIVPNTNGTNSDWTTYLTTVDAVETLTGYDFFTNLPEPIQRCTEAGVNGNNPPLDTDADGVTDSTDNCPFASNANQADFDQDSIGDICDADDDNDSQSDADEIACGSNPLLASSMAPDNDGDSRPDCVDPDDDNDGVIDTADNCRFTPNSGQSDNDQDGIGDVCDGDDDNDGVLDGTDNCSFSANPSQSDNDLDGIGDACDVDDDNDGVLDATDNCAFTPNPDQRDINGDGIGDVCTTFEIPSGGLFVIGNLVTQTGGATVNFWSPQWAQDNPMSGGAPPKAFKGFENGSELPTCGSTWTSQPGNSSSPPATIPRLMPVIVSSGVNQNGSVITGNVSSIVIIETDDGYGPSPGQAGTGKIIAILCTSQ